MALSILTWALIAGCALCLVWWVKTPRQSSLPPGPPADPILGHLRIIPMKNQSQIFHSWAKTYGDVIQLRLPGSSIVVLDSVQAANDLLDKSGANFSCRPPIKIFELMGWVPNLVFLQYGPQFVKHRKMFQRYIGRQESLAYQPYQEREAHVLVKNLLVHPESYDKCLRRFTAAVLIRIAYGHEVTSDDDGFLKFAEQIGEALNNSGPVGNTPVDWLPILQYFPSWFPGTHYANHARTWYPVIRKLYDEPVAEVQRKMANGNAPPSVVSSALEQASNGKEDLDLEDLKGVAATMYAAGLDTTWSTLGAFVLAMLLYPECQRKAQEEIESVIGSDRLPEFSDRERLPYLECILQETLRWYPIGPLAIPHRSLRDETYRDMFIPKGSIVFANQGGMSRDENVYSDPEVFKPERFLAKPGVEPEPHFSAFGFGRRLCPGRFLADASLWIAIACTLATLDFSKATDKDGKEIIPTLEPTSGIVEHLTPMPCVIRARSPQHEALINECV